MELKHTWTDMEQMEDAVRTLLRCTGEDVNREGLLDTPKRVAKMYMELTRGLREDPPAVTTFSSGTYDQLITVFDLEMASLCEHHCVPFVGKAHIGYIPGEHIVGLSKFGRILDWFSRRLQIQEQLTEQVADFIVEHLKPKGLIVVVEAQHMCMSIRGVKKPGHSTMTSAIRGDIPKEEFLSLMAVRNMK
jgi:GTP cyclohydrolase I